MAKASPVVLALFDDSAWARRAVDTLKAIGFLSDDIGILEPRRRRGWTGLHAHSGASRRPSVLSMSLAQSDPAASLGSIATAFVGRGMPADLAQHYEDEVRRGNSLLVVRTRGAAELAETILERFGAYDVRPFSARSTTAPESRSRSRSGSKSVEHGLAMHHIGSTTHPSRGGYRTP